MTVRDTASTRLGDLSQLMGQDLQCTFQDGDDSTVLFGGFVTDVEQITYRTEGLPQLQIVAFSEKQNELIVCFHIHALIVISKGERQLRAQKQT